MTVGDSRAVHSAQVAVHPRLGTVVRKHLDLPWRAAVPPHTRRAFMALRAALDDAARGGEPPPLVLDSGCGTGESTVLLAARWPQAIVLGVDKSAARLRSRFAETDDDIARAGNAGWLRADAATLWREMAEAGLRVAAHYVLYPNPWPKAAQLRRRWQAHPALPSLLRLGGVLELRCNWRVYADEFAEALAIAGHDATVAAIGGDEAPLSPFERKYRASGHALWRVRADLDAAYFNTSLMTRRSGSR